MHEVEIIAHLDRLAALRALRQPEGTCACQLLKLGYLPERRVGSVFHGFLVCGRYDVPLDSVGDRVLTSTACENTRAAYAATPDSSRTTRGAIASGALLKEQENGERKTQTSFASSCAEHADDEKKKTPRATTRGVVGPGAARQCAPNITDVCSGSDRGM